MPALFSGCVFLLYKVSLWNSFSKDDKDQGPLTCRHQYSHTMEYHSALKRKETLQSAITWTNTEDIMLSGISQSQKTLYDSTSMRHLRVVRIIETESRMVVARGWGEGRMGS